MDEERWVQLVERLESRAQADPKGYRRKVVRFAALGYAYIATALSVLLVLAAAVIYLGIHHPAPLLKLLLPIGALALVILRSLAVRIEPPEGIPLSRAEAPALHNAIDAVNHSVRGPSLHALLVDSDMNAGVVQVPRLGIFGSRNYLVTGLPLLQALTPTEFRAVLAHELAHLSRRHGRLGVWIYRVRATWEQLLTSLEARRSVATGVFRRFFEWYVPVFNAHTFPLMRTHEFEADRLAADAVGGDALGHALGRLAVADGFLHTRYWPSVLSGAGDDPAPPRTAFTQLAGRIRDAALDERSEGWLDAALSEEPGPTDSHPALAQRLAALGLDPSVLRTPDDDQERAADVYLGERATELAKQLDTQWHREIARAWRSEHKRVQAERAELRTLEEQRGSLDPEKQFTLAQLTEEHRSLEESLLRYREILETHPDDARARYAVGRILLELRDDAGLAELDRAMELDPDAVLPACELAIAYLSERGREAEATRYFALGGRRAALLDAAIAERDSFTLDDSIESAALPPEVERKLQQRLAAFPEVERVHVGRRRLEHLADEFPAYVVFVVADKRKQVEDEPTLAAQLADTIELPGQFHVLVRRRRSGDVKRFEENVPVPVYRRA
jgi:hypothetical protein